MKMRPDVERAIGLLRGETWREPNGSITVAIQAEEFSLRDFERNFDAGYWDSEIEDILSEQERGDMADLAIDFSREIE